MYAIKLHEWQLYFFMYPYTMSPDTLSVPLVDLHSSRRVTPRCTSTEVDDLEIVLRSCCQSSMVKIHE